MAGTTNGNGYLSKRGFWQLLAILAFNAMVFAIPLSVGWGKLNQEVAELHSHINEIKVRLNVTVERKKALERRIQSIEDRMMVEQELGMKQTPEQKRQQARRWFDEWHKEVH